MKALTFSPFFSIVLLYSSFRQAKSDMEFPPEGQAWLRICDKGNTYIGAEKSEGCSNGFWFDPPVSVGCVCGNGIWIFSTGWCDPNYITVIMRNGECYYIGEDGFKFIRNIGSSLNAYAEYHFVYSPGYEYIQGLTDGGNDPIYSFYHPMYTLLLGSVRPSTSVILGKDGRTCIDARNSKGAAYTTFAYDSKMKENVRRQGYTLAKSCSVGRDEIVDSDLYSLSYDYAEKAKAIGTDWSKINSTRYAKDDGTKCAECDPKNAPKLNESYIPSWDHPGWSPPKSRNRTQFTLEDKTGFPNEDYPESAESNMTAYMQEQNCKNWTYSLGSKNKTLVEINEQTKRMISAHIAYSLRKIQTPSVNVSEYKLFQKSRKILLKVCPETEVPVDLLNGLIRMFRVALKESMLVYPHQQMISQSETDALFGVLDQCLTEARPMGVQYDNATCPKTFIAVNYTYKVDAAELQRNLSTGMPCALETNATSYDLPLEAAWKIVMFTHYYCARHFKNNSIGHSRFEQIMESFFNRWMQHRWRNPGPSFEAYKFIFQMYNLTQFSQALDRCVAASRTYSAYRKWIRRPAYMSICGNDIFSANGLKINAELIRLSTNNRIAIKTHFYKRAFCSKTWHEPKTLFKIQAESSKKGPNCIQYVPDEWMDGQEPNDPWKQGAGSTKTLRQQIFESLIGGKSTDDAASKSANQQR